MGILSDVIQLRQVEQQNALADVQALGQAAANFINLSRQREELDLQQQNIRSQVQDRGTTDPLSLQKQQLQIEDLQGKIQQRNMLQEFLRGAQAGEQQGGLELSGFTGSTPQFDVDTMSEKLNRATQLRREFTGLQPVEELQTIRSQVASMDSLLEQAKEGVLDQRNALDQALITIFNKINDPTSVVRESEFARTQENLPIVNRIEAAFERFHRGGDLSIRDREELVLAAKIIANERGNIFNEEIDRFEGLSKEFKVPRSTVLGGIKRFEPFSLGGQSDPMQEIRDLIFEGTK